LFFLLGRHRQQMSARQADLFSQVTFADYLFERDRIYAYLNLDDNELFIYQRLYDLLAGDVPPPDLIVYLQAPTDFVLRHLRERGHDPDQPYRPNPAYVQKLNEAYQHFFFHHSSTPLLVVEISQVDLARSDAALEDLIRQIRGMGRGTRYYVPRTS
jgi:deoxyadenosine/deoxycytidine kinase